MTFAGSGSASGSTVSSAPVLDLSVGSTVSSTVGLDLAVSLMCLDLGIGGLAPRSRYDFCLCLRLGEACQWGFSFTVFV
jgi:hypothetical protein